MITILKTYVLNITIFEIFEKNIKLSKKSSTIWSNLYDEYGHWCDDIKDR